MHTSIWKRSAVAIGGAALLLSATIGFSQAQPATPTTTITDKKQHREAVVDLAAAKLGLTSDQLTTAFRDARKDLGGNLGAVKVAKLVHHELSLAATTLGIADAKTLRQQLAGTTLAAVAGPKAPAVAAALKADVNAKIQALVTAGKLKADRAAALTIKADAKVDAFMTRQFKPAA